MTQRKLNFAALENLSDDTVRRWHSREPNPVVQMSIRLPMEEYERFRILCKQERRTNGDMLRELVDAYLRKEK